MIRKLYEKYKLRISSHLQLINNHNNDKSLSKLLFYQSRFLRLVLFLFQLALSLSVSISLSNNRFGLTLKIKQKIERRILVLLSNTQFYFPADEHTPTQIHTQTIIT